MVPVKRSMGKAGGATIASTSPLRGSMTTTAPARPSMARSAASWIRRSTVVIDLGARMRLRRLDQPHRPAHRVDFDDARRRPCPRRYSSSSRSRPRLAHHVATPVSALLELLSFASARSPGRSAAKRLFGRPAGPTIPRSRRAARASSRPPFGDVVMSAAAHANGQEGVGRHAGDHRVEQVANGNPQQRSEPAEGHRAERRVALELPRDQRQREGGAVVDEREAVAVEEDAAGAATGRTRMRSRRTRRGTAHPRALAGTRAGRRSRRCAARDAGMVRPPARPGLDPPLTGIVTGRRGAAAGAGSITIRAARGR